MYFSKKKGKDINMKDVFFFDIIIVRIFIV